MDDVEGYVCPVIENEAEAVIKLASNTQVSPHLLCAHQGFAKLPMEEHIFAHEPVDDVIAREDEHYVSPDEFAWRVSCQPGIDAHVRWLSGDKTFFTSRVFKAKSTP